MLLVPSRGIFHKIITKKHIKIGFVSTHVKGWLDTDNFDKNDVLSEWLENILQRFHKTFYFFFYSFKY